MSNRTPAIAAAFVVCAASAAVVFAQQPTDGSALTRSRYLAEYTASGELMLPKNFHEWIYVGSPLTGLVARIGHLAARGGGYRRVGPFLTPDRHRAIQNEPRSPPSHPEAAAQGDELGRL